MKVIKELRLTSPIPPSVNHYLATRVVMKNGKPMSMVYETTEAKKYKQEFKKYIKEQVDKQGWEFYEDKTQHFYCDCVFYFGRIDQDCNNYFKLLLDSITESECVWIDDNVICERVNRIYYDKENPHIELVIKPVEYVGIFKDTIEYENFESRCKCCKRYNRNCSLLRNAVDGRIQPEIDMDSYVCSKYKD